MTYRHYLIILLYPLLFGCNGQLQDLFYSPERQMDRLTTRHPQLLESDTVTRIDTIQQMVTIQDIDTFYLDSSQVTGIFEFKTDTVFVIEGERSITKVEVRTNEDGQEILSVITKVKGQMYINDDSKELTLNIGVPITTITDKVLIEKAKPPLLQRIKSWLKFGFWIVVVVLVIGLIAFRRYLLAAFKRN